MNVNKMNLYKVLRIVLMFLWITLIRDEWYYCIGNITFTLQKNTYSKFKHLFLEWNILLYALNFLLTVEKYFKKHKKNSLFIQQFMKCYTCKGLEAILYLMYINISLLFKKYIITTVELIHWIYNIISFTKVINF